MLTNEQVEKLCAAIRSVSIGLWVLGLFVYFGLMQVACLGR